MKNIKMTSDALKKKESLICLNVLSKYNPEKHSNTSKRLPVKFFSGVLIVLMNTDNWASLEKRFSSEIANWRSGGNVICIAIGELGKFKGNDIYYLKTLQIALMNVDDNWIPADSSYELTMLNYLHKHERSFIKPLRYDASNNDVFPDFCLTDIGSTELFPIEVFGMDTASYLARKVIKESYYNERYGGSRDFPSKNDKVLWRPRRPWPPEGYYFSLTGKYPSIERISSSRSGNFSLNSKW
ncbi:DUF1173 family protein [Klebsiella pneumoniae]|uniref:DUF1173 family protein n=3 Tax=Enterobacteriaceae TaxID=543 RepID=UPI00236339C2|nr:DUF1173 family protein [Klebsiella pneumoniae]MDD1320395.1 DUF1173 family protein [Klebsiella pneumoniae]